MFYTIYKITNLLDGKIYIGAHKTKKLDDAYMGSGKYLKSAQKKYGMDNFKKDILFVFDNPEEMYAKEAELVNEEFLMNENTYNLKVGGFGGWDYANTDKQYMKKDSYRKTRSDIAVNLYKSGKIGLSLHSDVSKAKRAQTLQERGIKFSTVHMQTSEVNEKRIHTMKEIGHQSGQKNSQHGTRWIHSVHDRKSKKILKDEPLPDGWLEGRKMKF